MSMGTVEEEETEGGQRSISDGRTDLIKDSSRRTRFLAGRDGRSGRTGRRCQL